PAPARYIRIGHLGARRGFGEHPKKAPIARALRRIADVVAFDRRTIRGDRVPSEHHDIAVLLRDEAGNSGRRWRTSKGVGDRRDLAERLQTAAPQIERGQLDEDGPPDLILAVGNGEDSAIESRETVTRRMRCDRRAIGAAAEIARRAAARPEVIAIGRDERRLLIGDQLATRA